MRWGSADTLTGRAGSDATYGADTSADFRRGQGDKTDLSVRGANGLMAGDDAFALLGAKRFRGKAGADHLQRGRRGRADPDGRERRRRGGQGILLGSAMNLSASRFLL
ncbi:hypothetical protein GCM10010964_28100 [Caldovatus sediminis]|uniref:Uncharacterized protein n=1 Tax=Caldovatus sediminis TaxID=2041189 RepID=A0A8J3ED29_9PROT|nr:hypothetical protein GCM10010964_28100 [Caldovatus sediminis]